AFHRIHAHVVEFLDSLLLAPNIEIVKSALPKAPRLGAGSALPQVHLVRITPFLFAHHPRDTLFQDLHHLVENFQEHIPFPGGAKQRAPTMTTAGDEVQMALPVAAFETILQGKVKPPRTLCSRSLGTAQRVRHPELQLQRPKQITSRLTIAVVSSRFAVRQDAKHQITVGKERVGHPPSPPAPSTITKKTPSAAPAPWSKLAGPRPASMPISSPSAMRRT